MLFRSYAVVSTPIPETVLDASDAIRPADADGSDPDLRRYHVRADDRPALNALLDRLRSAGAELESVQPLRQTLEDYFIDVVDAQAQEREAKRPS